MCSSSIPTTWAEPPVTPSPSGNKLPPLGLRRLALYAVEAASRLFTRSWKFGRRHLSYYVLLADYRLRRSILSSSLPLDDFDLIICEHPTTREC